MKVHQNQNAARKMLLGLFVSFVSLLSTISASFCLSISALAQADQTPKRGFHPAGSYALGDIETINTTNGNLMLRIPLASLPAGRAGLSHSVGLHYNSKLYDQYTSVGEDPFLPPPNNVVNQERLSFSNEGGWMYTFGYDLQIIDRVTQYQSTGMPQCPDVAANYRYKLKMRFPDGSLHEFRPLGGFNYQLQDWFRFSAAGHWEDCSGPTWTATTLRYYSIDSTHMRLDVQNNSGQVVSWTLYLPGGERVTGGNQPSRIYDRNNNYIEFQSVADYNQTGRPADLIVDQMGRSLVIEHNYTANEDYVRAQGFNNQTLTWTVKWNEMWVLKKYAAAGGSPYFGYDGAPWTEQVYGFLHVVEQITLPTQMGGLSYTFDYNSNATWPNESYGWGELTSVTLPEGVRPSGATTVYQYSRQGYTSPGDHLSPVDVLNNFPARKDLTYWLEYDGGANQTTETWLYNINPQGGWSHITNPDGGIVREDFTIPGHYWSAGLVHKTTEADGDVVERLWLQNIPYGMTPQPGYWTNTGVNTYVKTEFRSIRDAGGSLVKTAIKDFTYDKNGNVTQVAEYDWVAYSSIPHDINGKPTGIPGGLTPKRVIVNTYYNQTPDASNTTTDDPYVYHKTTSPNLKKAIESSETRLDVGAGTVLSRTESVYDNPATTGNLIAERSWDSTKGAITRPLEYACNPTPCNSISVTHQYDAYGNRTLTTDARGYQTQFTYDPVNGSSNLYPTQTKTAYSTAVQRQTTQQYDFYTGLVTQSTDVDNNVTTKTTYDVFGRPTLVEEADGVAGVERQTATEYSDTARRVIIRADLNTTGDQKLVSIQHYDQLGRVRLSRSLEDASTQSATNEQHGIKVQTRYAYSGSNSYEVVSAAYRAATSGAAGGEAEMAWRRTKSDQGGKIIELETFAGASLPAPWGSNTTSTGKVVTGYDAEFTTVTDQVNRSRRSMVDGLGRLVRMDEPDATTGSLGTTASPVQPTSYTYNALDKLTQSVQGSQTRTFTYSSLSRLTSATNPENGTVSYTYDNNGNLATKTDARSIVSTYTYDQLNRNTGISYSGGTTPAINRYYDGATKGKGKLWYSLSYNVHPTSGQLAYSYTIVDSYDEMGRAKTGSQNFLTNNGSTWMSYPISRTFDVAGNVKTQSYPSTRATSYNYDNAGRISSFSGNIGDGVSRTYADSFLFNAQGQIKRERFGTKLNDGTPNPLYHNIHYNSRGQAVDIRLGTNSADEWHWNRGALITYFSNQARSAGNAFLNASDNNGNVTMQEHYVPTDDAISSYAIPLRDTYEYDNLNRVTQANGVQRTTGGSWPSVYAQHYSYDRWGNRWINSGGTWGTNIFNTVITPNSANNRLTGMTYDFAGNTINDPITGGGARTYDADNRMISAQSGATWNYYVYDADGKRVRRIVAGVETWHVYGFSGELLAEYPVNGATGSPSKEYANGGQTMIVGDATNVRWTVADSLGTPRIVVGKTGNLADVTRHDYLPFGEELFVGMGTSSIRTTGMGYATGGTNDGIRKKFTGYERDDETGLDYAQARYYSSKQGRFTSPDEFTGGPDELYDFADVASENPMIYAELDEPQSLNKYQYCFNNPLSLVDPDGHKSWKDWARTVVEVATYVPGPIGTVASVVQAVDKLAQGDYAGAASSALGAVPGAKLVRAGAKAIDKVADVSRIVDKANDLRKDAKVVQKAADNLNKSEKTLALG